MTTPGRPNCATCGKEVPRFRWTNADVRAEAAYRREHPDEPPKRIYCSPDCAFRKGRPRRVATESR